MSINRKALVARHSIHLTQPDAQTPLTVGNGEFAFTADITGLQTFPDFHLQEATRLSAPVQGEESGVRSMPLGTQAQWGWHTLPNPAGYRLEDTLNTYTTARGPVTYPDRVNMGLPGQTHQEGLEAGTWLRGNPHRIDLGRVGLEWRSGEAEAPPVQITDLADTRQTLDLWRGMLVSTFYFDNQPVRVLTLCHPDQDLLAVRIISPLLADGRLAVRIAFPYPQDHWFLSVDWSKPHCHSTQHEMVGTRCTFVRTLDESRYYVVASWTKGAALVPIEQHQYRLLATGAETLDLVMAFAPASITGELPSFAQVQAAAAAHWEAFWMQGGVVDLSASRDPRAHELERRIVLSQYQTAINCAGSLPPQETGLVCNSWFGKFHLEMHWWHAAHFALWGRTALLERSLPWYQRILPVARAIAQRQGYQGARWPKQVGPDGRESPSTVGPFLIWQQPHPIYYAELVWRARPEVATLERYRDLVFETASFMASFTVADGERYILDAPLIPAQETYGRQRTTVRNPTFELAYWYWGLETAQRWRERLGLERDPLWERVKSGLARPPVRDGIYTAIETPPYTLPNDHPSMVAALGFLPHTPLIDPEIMRATLHAVFQQWDWESTWGWDYPMLALCAARLGEPELAIEALLLDAPKNTYLANGHNRQRPNLPLYLPGNGGLLAAIALMVAGWDDGPQHSAPGFPSDGTWVVQAEGLLPLP